MALGCVWELGNCLVSSAHRFIEFSQAEIGIAPREEYIANDLSLKLAPRQQRRRRVIVVGGSSDGALLPILVTGSIPEKSRPLVSFQSHIQHLLCLAN